MKTGNLLINGTFNRFRLCTVKKMICCRTNPAAHMYDTFLFRLPRLVHRKLIQLVFVCTVLLGAVVNIGSVSLSGVSLRLVNSMQHLSYKRNSCSPFSYAIQDESENYQQLWIECDMAFIDRLSCYNQVVTLNRNKMLSRNTASLPWPKPASTMFYANLSNTLQMEELRNSSTVITTIYLDYLGPRLDSNWTFRHPLANRSFLQIRYFDWEGMYPVCEWLSSFIGYSGDRPCFHSSLSRPNKQSSQSFDVAFFTSQMTGGIDRPYISYIHLIRKATVYHVGYVFTSDAKIALPACYLSGVKGPPKFNKRRIFDEIFVISQSSGEEYYHKMLENMPRLAPFLPFLRQHPNIRIHMIRRDGHTDVLFRALHLDPNRIVTGNVHANLVYLPYSSGCQRPLINEIKLLSQEYRDYIATNLTGEKAWNSVLVIKRTKKRQFIQQQEIENVVSELAKSFDMRYELFSDDPPPSPEETMLMFYRARVIIAPHGAGLTNMLFSRPGTHVIEVACSDRPMCFLMAAYELGHRYFGISANGKCATTAIDVNVEHIETVLKRFLNEIRSEQNNILLRHNEHS